MKISLKEYRAMLKEVKMNYWILRLIQICVELYRVVPQPYTEMHGK